MAPGDLRRDELIELVEAITRGDAATEEQDDRLVLGALARGVLGPRPPAGDAAGPVLAGQRDG